MGGPNKQGLNPITSYCMSASAACVAETATFPFDMVKTRLMIQGNEKGMVQQHCDQSDFPGDGGPPRAVAARALVAADGAAERG